VRQIDRLASSQARPAFLVRYNVSINGGSMALAFSWLQKMGVFEVARVGVVGAR
jgi:hypothetical protein